MIRFFPLFFMALAVFAAPCALHAQTAPPPIQFLFPLACTLGQDCWTVNYVDTNLAPGSAADFTCGGKTYDDHKGTDFALRSLAEVETGIDVLAAASGKVARLREGEDDIPKTPEQLEEIRTAQKECGNAVLLDHGSGLFTLYCHLKKDSVTVKIGDEIQAGQKIAQAGHSGMAEFPHLHFGVMKGDKVIDPYTGLSSAEGCGKTQESLWALGLPMAYEPVAFFDAGFSDALPDFEEIKKGALAPVFLSSSGEALVFWVALYGMRESDLINLEIRGPDGNVFAERSISQDKNRARQYYYAGRKITEPLPTGTYTGKATLSRKTENSEEIKIDITRSSELR